MELMLTGRSKVRDVKKQFEKLFPFLKLEFFSYRHGSGQGSLQSDSVADGTSLCHLLPDIEDTVFMFAPSDTVLQFEQRMQNELGLPVQVFRRAGSLWLQTVQTDHLTLEKQNIMGKEASSPLPFNPYTLFL